MRLLILGGTAWLGHTTAARAAAAGDDVTCLARGDSGPAPDGVRLVRADRDRADAYDELSGEWDAVLDVSRTPRHVRGALAALAQGAAHWTFVSTGNVYRDNATRGLDESAELLPPGEGGSDEPEAYGAAKVAAEAACLDALGDRLLIARSGLIGGPGDPSDRTGAWVARCALAPHEPLLVPADRSGPTQVVDVRDLVDWLLHSARTGVAGTFNAVGPTTTLDDWVGLSRDVAGHDGELVEADADWLASHDVAAFAGEDSLAMWLPDPEWQGFLDRDGSAAVRAGLRHRPQREVVADILDDERRRGLDRVRRTGLSRQRERELVAELAAAG